MDNKDIYLTKTKSSKFNQHTLVKYITCIGECYMVADLNDNSKREYLMRSELYPVDWSPKNSRPSYMFNAELQAIADRLLM